MAGSGPAVEIAAPQMGGEYLDGGGYGDGKENSPEAHHLAECHDCNNRDEWVEIHRALEHKRLDDIPFEKVDYGKGGNHLEDGDAALKLDKGKEEGGIVARMTPMKGSIDARPAKMPLNRG